MKTRTPIDRNDLRIKKNDKVLEIGSGHNPSYRSNVLVDKYIDNNYHRSGDLKKYPHQQFINATGENLPFKDKEFDYIICNQVLEHADDPIQFIKELERVGKGGYIETPSLVGESLFPKSSHKWAVLEIDNKLVLFEKEKMNTISPNLGVTFLNYLPYRSIALRLFYLSTHQAHTVRYEWRDHIDIIVNPTEKEYVSFFLEEWTEEMTTKIFPYKTKKEDVISILKALAHLINTFIKRKIHTQKPQAFIPEKK